MSELYQSLSHSQWDCQYQVVLGAQTAAKVDFRAARRQLGAIVDALARQKECQIMEGHRMPDHVPVGMAIPPKHPVASVIGFLQGSVRLPSLAGAAKRNSTGEHFWLGATRYPAWASSWSRSVRTSASRRRRMATTKASAVKK